MDEDVQRRTRGRAARRRFAAAAGTIAIHGLAGLAVLHTWGAEPARFETPPMEVALVPPPPPPPVVLPVAEPAPAEAPTAPAPPAPPAPEPPKPATPKPPPVPHRVIKRLEPSEVPPRVVPPEPAPPLAEISVSAAELAAATTAESEAAGGGGGEGAGFGGGGGTGAGGRCDMVARLQRALRNDASVRTVLTRTRRAPGFEGRPLMVWNGDWVRHGEEEGKGLASLRQAIAVEVAFAPKPCRSQAMRGLVLLSLTDSPGAPRIVLGARAWRWSDLLSLR